MLYAWGVLIMGGSLMVWGEQPFASTGLFLLVFGCGLVIGHIAGYLQSAWHGAKWPLL